MLTAILFNIFAGLTLFRLWLVAAWRDTAPLHVYYSGSGEDWVVARTADEATDILVNQCGYSREEAEEDGWDRLPDDQPLKMFGYCDEDETLALQATCQSWAMRNGVGVLGSRDW